MLRVEGSPALSRCNAAFKFAQPDNVRNYHQGIGFGRYFVGQLVKLRADVIGALRVEQVSDFANGTVS